MRKKIQIQILIAKCQTDHVYTIVCVCKQKIQPDFATAASVDRASSFFLLLDYGVFECTAHNIQHGTWSLISYSNSSLLIFMFLCTHMVDYMGCFGFGCKAFALPLPFNFSSVHFVLQLSVHLQFMPTLRASHISVPSFYCFLALLLFENPYPSVTLQNVIVVKNRRHLYATRLPFYF